MKGKRFVPGLLTRVKLPSKSMSLDWNIFRQHEVSTGDEFVVTREFVIEIDDKQECRAFKRRIFKYFF